MEKKLVLTVCSGNIQRSVIAQLCLSRELVNIGREAEFEVISRGIQGTMGTDDPKFPNLRYYSTEYGHTEPCLREIGIEIPVDQKATVIDEEIVERASLILVMEDDVFHTKKTPKGELMSLVAQFPEHAYKMRLFMELVGKQKDVADCYGKDDADFHRQMVMDINEGARDGIRTMIRWVEELEADKERRFGNG
ncbi:MAG: hypothetical protein A2744_00220 [Candidatus Buchananbacteria bacterium RIFCSPHIGHO2_01_FULL_44_11]|uniref:protein-tyrosine-phosphatase n=1 Tax=Candidatus Buchananbacteria bacterium RIFCSPHIGHO2_01_FULL_44_11 TaxID=1797535 RepID=A0A1G1Y0F8_9BACT|nr:MAG: hypothetical protein A2744_00220 [Candidatus Buchananbacteria bacterium RIFCSPHIGHO2_01_FULL_44_11]